MEKELFVKATMAVLDKYGDDSKLSQVLRSGRENVEVFDQFCVKIVDSFRPLTQQARVKALSKFHQLCITVLQCLWNQLFTELQIPVVPALTTQTVNRHLLNLVLTEGKSASVQTEAEPVVMGSEEENAVRYASGYVAMKLMKEFMKEDSEKAAQFVECLSNMAIEGEESDYYVYTREWLRMVDRGGLFNVCESTFLFFRAVEVATQAVLPRHLQNPSGSSKESLHYTIIADEDVQFYWSMVSVDLTDELSSTELLQHIVEMWVKIRGFSMTSAWLEEYKCASQKKTKAKKGLRKQLQSTAPDP